MKCTCGFENALGARFCGSCGATLEGGPAAAVPEAATLAAGGRAPRSVANAGGRRSSRVPLAILGALAVVAAAGYWWLRGLPEGVMKTTGIRPARTGTFAINPQFDDAAPFSEGLAFVIIGDASTGKVGYIDKSGRMVIAPRFDSGVVPPSFLSDRHLSDRTYRFRAKGFHEGLAAVLIGDASTGKYGYIDETGKMVINPVFNYAVDFSEGLAFIRDEATSRYGYIDKTGKVVVNPHSGFGYDFSEGFAEVAVGNTHGYIDRSGTMIVPPLSEVGGPRFSEGLAAMRIGGRWGYFDKTGRVAINPQFAWASEFSEGLAMVSVGEGDMGKSGYIDKTGQMIITAQFEGAGSFSEGLAVVRIGGRAGFIDRTGKVVINPQFDVASEFSQGLAAVRMGDDTTGKYGYIDKTGRMIIAPTFDYGDKFSEGLARVRIGGPNTGKWGYIYR
jgi:hypothetical protein